MRIAMALGLSLSFAATVLPAKDPPLPGPQLDIPVDLNGDGISTFGDRWTFNYWLKLGGSLEEALASGQQSGEVIDLSAFFTGPDSALSEDAAILRRVNDGGASDGGAGILAPCPSCSTTARLTATFGGGGNGVQTGCVYCDTDALQAVDGHTLTSAGFLYVTREVNGANAGVTGINITDAEQSGHIPIPATRVSKIITTVEFCRADQIAWDAVNNDLLVSQENQQCAAPNNAGAVKRVDLDVNPPTYANEFLPGSGGLTNPEGLAMIPQGACAFGNPGELLLAEDIVGGRIKKFGHNTDTFCLTGVKTVFDPVNVGFNRPECIGFGDFNGAGTLGAYFAETVTGTVRRVTATDPNTYISASFATGMVEPDNVVFDPYSQSLFVDEDQNPGRIWRIKPDSTKVVFATSLASPQGMSFHQSGVMLVSEQSSSRVIVIDGWRNKFNRGDANGDGQVDISDPITINSWLFQGGPVPGCLDAADANDDGAVDISDPQYIMDYLFQGTEAPKPPFFGVDPGSSFCTDGTPVSQAIDPTADLLGCRSYLAPCEIPW